MLTYQVVLEGISMFSFYLLETAIISPASFP